MGCMEYSQLVNQAVDQCNKQCLSVSVVVAAGQGQHQVNLSRSDAQLLLQVSIWDTLSCRDKITEDCSYSSR